MYNVFYMIKCKPFGSKHSVSILYSWVMWEIKNKDYFWQCALCFTNLRLWLLSNLPPSRPLSVKDNFIQCWTGNIQKLFDLNIMLSTLQLSLKTTKIIQLLCLLSSQLHAWGNASCLIYQWIFLSAPSSLPSHGEHYQNLGLLSNTAKGTLKEKHPTTQWKHFPVIMS